MSAALLERPTLETRLAAEQRWPVCHEHEAGPVRATSGGRLRPDRIAGDVRARSRPRRARSSSPT